MVNVLLADDDYNMVSLLKTLLRLEGFATASLFDQKGDMLETIRRERPDIILLDIYLGDRNGLDLVRKIRETEDLAGVYVIMVSGIDKRAECVAAGANDFLLKPYMPEELFAKLRSAP